MADTTRKSDKEEYVHSSDMPLEEGNKEVKGRKELNILTPNKLLTRLPILLAQIEKLETINTNLKTKSGKFYVFCISTIKSQKNFIIIY